MKPSASPAVASITVETCVHFGTGRRQRKQLIEGPAPPLRLAVGRVPRVARLMALAIHFDDLIRRGEIHDYADIARSGQVTRARATQIMALLNLAPDIQEQILFLPRTLEGRDPVTERELRPIVANENWASQRHLWIRIGAVW